MFSKFFSYLFSKIMGSKEESQKTELVELDQVTADELLTSLCQEAVESGEIEVVPEPISVSDKIDVARMFNEFGYLDTKASESFIDKELIVKGVFGRKIWDTWYQVSELLKSEKVDLKKMITHRFPLSEFEKAMEVMRSGECGKILLIP